MDNATYRVTFQGKVVEGETEAEVKKRLTGRLNLSPSKLQILFSGQTTVIKKNASLATCEKIKQMFVDSGALCRIEPDTGPANKQPVDPSAQKAVGPPPLPPVTGTQSEGMANSVRPPNAGETFCPTCGTSIKLNDLACPGCGNKVKKKESLPGCAIVAIVVGVFFVAVAILGILAAIAIPNFIAYRNKAIQSEIKTELQNISMAQHEYYSEHSVYTMDLDRLNYQRSDKAFDIEMVSADESCFLAVGSSPRLHHDVSIDCHGTSKEIEKAIHQKQTGSTG